MVFNIITLFPQAFESTTKYSIIKRAIGQKLIKINFINPRDFAKDAHKTVDDKPFGGGRGMVMKVDIMTKAIESINKKSYKILLSASGKKYNQSEAQKLAKKKNITLICGHYEGIDARVEKFVDETLSIGDYILTGGEIAAMVIIDSVSRLIPGVIKKESTDFESFSPSTINDLPFTLLEYPQYTRPEAFRGLRVPKILLLGNHQKIAEWRDEQSQKLTKKLRPDLLRKASK